MFKKKKPALTSAALFVLASLLVVRAWADGFAVSYQAGGQDAAQRFMGGTEIMALASHKGRLFAAVGYWEDEPGADPTPGPQILRKDASGAGWMVERSFGTAYLRVDSLASLRFTTDADGAPLNAPVFLLAAGLSDASAPLRPSIWVRNDVTRQWTVSQVWPARIREAGMRCAIVHRDKITGIDHVFACAEDEIYRGGFDPDRPGKIRWDSEAELSADFRGLAFARANGDLYVSISNAVYRRIDGPTPAWEAVYQWPGEPRFNQLRGLTAIDNPDGPGQVLLGGREIRSNRILRIDPSAGHAVSVELDIKTFLQQLWGGPVRWTIPAYNKMLAVTDPVTLETVHLIGLQAAHPDPIYDAPRAFYLVRRPDATYTLGTAIVCGAVLPGEPQALRAVRSIALAPFGDGTGARVLMAGFDADFAPAHNTAWIYEAALSDVLAPPPDCP